MAMLDTTMVYFTSPAALRAFGSAKAVGQKTMALTLCHLMILTAISVDSGFSENIYLQICGANIIMAILTKNSKT